VEYIIEVTGYHAGRHTVYVRLNHDGTRSVIGSPFGYSRDYDVATDRDAVIRLMTEHGCKLVSMKQV
jgi:hypothetical protein